MKVLVYTAISVLLVLSLISTAFILSSRSIIDNNKASSNLLIGHIDESNCTMIKGWAWDPEMPDTPLKIGVYTNGSLVKGELVSNTLANKPRPDIAALLTGDKGNHGFEMKVPENLKNSKNNLVYIYAFDFNDSSKFVTLQGSPTTVNCQ